MDQGIIANHKNLLSKKYIWRLDFGCTPIYIYIYKHTRTYSYIHIYMRARAHTHTHTHLLTYLLHGAKFFLRR